MWDKRYSRESYAYGTESNDFLREQAGRLPIGDTLCRGDGEGRNAIFLAEPGHEVHEGAFHNGTSAVVQLVARKHMTAG